MDSCIAVVVCALTQGTSDTWMEVGGCSQGVPLIGRWGLRLTDTSAAPNTGAVYSM